MPDCEAIKGEVEELIRKMGFEEDLKVNAVPFGDKFCAVDIDVKRPFIRMSVFEAIKDYLQARGYRVSAADVFSRCHIPEAPLQFRMNVYED